MKSTPRFLATDRPALAPFAEITARLPFFSGAFFSGACLSGGRERFPTVDEIDAACSADASVRFESAPPRPRRGPRPVVPYDERVAEGVVPTRPSSLHDLMNAVVWAGFPRSKRLVHAQQLRLLQSSADRSKRSPEHDTIAMLDEGGVLFAGSADAPDAVVVFGHAILEHVLTSADPVFGLGVHMESVERPLGELDRELAGMLERPGRFVSHRSFPRVRVGG